jgi:uncharacterized membrane protein
VRLLDIFIATLIVFPWVTEWGSFEGTSMELPDYGLPLLIVALVVEAVLRWRRVSWRARLWSSAAVAASAALLGWLFENHRDVSTRAIWHLTHGPSAVLVVALVAAAIRRYSSEPWEKSLFVRLGIKLGRAWLGALERAGPRPLWVVTAVVALAWFCVSLLRHWALDSHGYDLGIFTNVMWNLTHGNGYVSAVKGGINLFADHQSPTYWLLAPVFWLVPRPETLVFVQALGLAAGGPALYYLARARFGPGPLGQPHWAPAALPWLYWAYLPTRNANAFDFHPEVFMLPLFLWAFVGFASDRRWAKALGFAALVAALGTKESAPVVAVGIGVAWALTGGGWRGAALALAGVALFFFDVKVVPRMFGDDYSYMNLYGRFGGGIGDLLLAPFTQPGFFLSQLINAERLNFLFWTLAPLGLLPLFDWRAALAAAPPYLMLLLAEGDQRVRIVFHYGIEPASALFWALPLGLAACARRFGWQRTGLWMLFWAVAAYGPGELARARSYLPQPQTEWMVAEVLPCLSPDAPMAASDTLIPHLSTRAWIGYPDQLEQRPSGDPVRCVVTDLRMGLNWPLGRGGVERVLATLPERGYRLAWRCGDFTVYELGSAGCMRCVPSCGR